MPGAGAEGIPVPAVESMSRSVARAAQSGLYIGVGLLVLSAAARVRGAGIECALSVSCFETVRGDVL